MIILICEQGQNITASPLRIRNPFLRPRLFASANQPARQRRPGFIRRFGSAFSWSRWREEAPNPNDGSFNYAYKPDWGPETNPALVQSGGGSQHVGLSWNPWHAGIRQTITVPPGARVRVTAYGRTFASTPDFPNPSDTSVASRMQIGVDPDGGAEWWSGRPARTTRGFRSRLT